MKLIGWITLITLVLLALFAVANWTLLIAPAALNFLVFTVQGPLGLIFLGAALWRVMTDATHKTVSRRMDSG